MVKFAVIAGARPNFVKVAPLMEALKKAKHVQPILVHTGQHYDHLMSAAFFQDLEMPSPDIYLKVGSGTHAEQTAKILLAFEEYLLNNTVGTTKFRSNDAGRSESSRDRCTVGLPLYAFSRR
jgi:UDP-N-acetylglucosamine 2-epimerase (non-hydrolysing)